MRRLSLVICALVLLSACGRKTVRVQVPSTQSSSSAAAEMEGIASYYAEPYHGRKTANGETFDTYREMTAAHKTLPFNTMVRVTNKTNGREVDVRINDRGPFIEGRVIDLSLRAAREIDLERAGVAPVKIAVLKTAEQVRPTSFVVQVGAFENQQAAENLKQRLEKKYSGVTIQTVSEDRTLYRVRIGQPDLNAANRVVSELRSEDLRPFIVRLN